MVIHNIANLTAAKRLFAYDCIWDKVLIPHISTVATQADRLYLNPQPAISCPERTFGLLR